MYYILIVEDDAPTLEQLAGFLRDSFPGSTVELAKTVAEGRRLVQKASALNHSYDLVVLDFKLPKDEGEASEVDESLCGTIRKEMPLTVVAHITGHPNDQRIEDHVRNVHLAPHEAGADNPDDCKRFGFWLSKKKSSWPEELVRQFRQITFGNSIRRQIDELFRREEAFSAHSNRQTTRCLTHELARLLRDITQHWNDLDADLKGQIRKTFVVDETESPIRISLI